VQYPTLAKFVRRAVRTGGSLSVSSAVMGDPLIRPSSDPLRMWSVARIPPVRRAGPAPQVASAELFADCPTAQPKVFGHDVTTAARLPLELTVHKFGWCQCPRHTNRWPCLPPAARLGSAQDRMPGDKRRPRSRSNSRSVRRSVCCRKHRHNVHSGAVAMPNRSAEPYPVFHSSWR
jgi:hypothetical protein